MTPAAPARIRILGIDPGTRRCGYGIVDATGRKLAYVECGVIETPARAPLEDRLADLASSIDEVLAELRPDAVAVEDVFHGIDARAALILGHARGVVLARAGAAKLRVHAYPPATVKKSVAGHGSADKSSVSRVVQVILALKAAPKVDATDALAVAICHAYHAPARLLREQAAIVLATAKRARARRGAAS